MDFRLESMMRLAAVDSILPWLSDALLRRDVVLGVCSGWVGVVVVLCASPHSRRVAGSVVVASGLRCL
jgi:hypothetical protein